MPTGVKCEKKSSRSRSHISVISKDIQVKKLQNAFILRSKLNICYSRGSSCEVAHSEVQQTISVCATSCIHVSVQLLNEDHHVNKIQKKSSYKWI